LSNIVALLGPTNTGKTHRAVERMLEHQTGMIGLPLRLLAREVYDRVSLRVGEQEVALITGEEKRVGKRARYWVCTTESMPVDRVVDFIAIDEVQLAAHPQRGHVFTDRLLNFRGREETWFMGADTIVGMVEQLVPSAEIQRHPRMSKLRASGVSSLGSLPPRSAVIAFSAAEVYTLAERLRRRKGGAAVVLGALSPRTRNSQVAMYQAGEVDFLVATDAIGMGLNMDVDHVAFASLRKFDGTRVRSLTAAELAQIAGRAGRYTRDGTFGTIAPLELHPDAVFAIEGHRFAPLKRVMWRNSDLDTSSIKALLASLEVRPKQHGLVMADDADDEVVLRLLSDRDEIRAHARTPENVRLLWDICRIPDFRRLLPEHHATLLAEIYVQVAGPEGRISPDFMHQRISRLEDTRGEIDSLMMRMEFIRTWNYIAQHKEWVLDAVAWQARTQRAEDRLSEALHEQLISRFVETTRRGRRSTGGQSRPRTKVRSKQAERQIQPDSPFAALLALRDKLRDVDDAELPLSDELVEALVDADYDRFRVTADAALHIVIDDEDVEVASLTRGSDLLHPELKITTRELGPGGYNRVLRRLRAFTRDFVNDALGPLRDERLATLSAAGRGLVYQLEQSLGSVESKSARPQFQQLTDGDKKLLRRLGFSFGQRFIYAERLLAPDAIERRAALCNAYGRSVTPDGDAPSLPAARNADPMLVEATGYWILGGHAVRIDVVESLHLRLAELAKASPFLLPDAVVELLATSVDDAERIVTAMGYPRTAEGFIKKRRRGRSSRRGKKR
jgi:ATP-dependent RNA helicase SUPV3L1/SUV3